MSNSGWITFFGCISDSLQPLTVHCHWLWSVQPIYSGICNTAKSCTQYSQNICSVNIQIVTIFFDKQTYKQFMCTLKNITLQIYWLYSVQLFAVLRLPLSFGCTQSSWWLCTANGCNESEMQPNKAPIWIFVFGCSNIWPVRIELLKVICHTFYHMPYNLKY